MSFAELNRKLTAAFCLLQPVILSTVCGLLRVTIAAVQPSNHPESKADMHEVVVINADVDVIKGSGMSSRT